MLKELIGSKIGILLISKTKLDETFSLFILVELLALKTTAGQRSLTFVTGFMTGEKLL